MSQSATVGTFVTLHLLQVMMVAFVAQRYGTNIIFPFMRLCCVTSAKIGTRKSDPL
ncbi:hypothetical protein Hdeb2414_s0001g00015491 [Helianthus debilis subsp. tardiflorus]